MYVVRSAVRSRTSKRGRCIGSSVVSSKSVANRSTARAHTAVTTDVEVPTLSVAITPMSSSIALLHIHEYSQKPQNLILKVGAKLFRSRFSSRSCQHRRRHRIDTKCYPHIDFSTNRFTESGQLKPASIVFFPDDSAVR